MDDDRKNAQIQAIGSPTSDFVGKDVSYSSEGEKREIWGILDGFEIWARCGVWWLRSGKNVTGMITDEISAVYE